MAATKHWQWLCHRLWLWLNIGNDYVTGYGCDKTLTMTMSPAMAVTKHWQWLCHRLWLWLNIDNDYVTGCGCDYTLTMTMPLAMAVTKHWQWLCQTMTLPMAVAMFWCKGCPTWCSGHHHIDDFNKGYNRLLTTHMTAWSAEPPPRHPAYRWSPMQFLPVQFVLRRAISKCNDGGQPASLQTTTYQLVTWFILHWQEHAG